MNNDREASNLKDIPRRDAKLSITGLNSVGGWTTLSSKGFQKLIVSGHNE